MADQKKRSGPAVSDRATTTPPSAITTLPHGDASIDLALIGTDGNLWSRIFNGEFRLAVRCSVCGRWLTAGKSKTAGVGPNCAARGRR